MYNYCIGQLIRGIVKDTVTAVGGAKPFLRTSQIEKVAAGIRVRTLMLRQWRVGTGYLPSSVTQDMTQACYDFILTSPSRDFSFAVSTYLVNL